MKNNLLHKQISKISRKYKVKQNDRCGENYCNELNAVGGICLEHYQQDI